MRLFILLASAVSAANGCLTTASRTYSAGPTYTAPSGCGGCCVPDPCAQQQAAAAAAVARAAPNAVPAQPVAQVTPHQSVLEALLGRTVSTSEFSADGYNNAGGGPVSKGASLSCYMDGRPCCWANVPPPDDQLDWQIATGRPQTAAFQNAPAPDGSYLIAYARGAAPSDEAQFASCAISCASSPIIVRANQRTSCCKSANIVFVASNFVGEKGDIAILDDIEISYESDGAECQAVAENGAEAAQRLTVETNSGSKTATISDKHLSEAAKDLYDRRSKIEDRLNMAIDRNDEEEFDGEESVIESVRRAHGEQTVFASGSENFNKDICENTKCDFEDDAHQTQSIRGTTTRFQVVTGQFMNRVTGVKESIEGSYYAATFLFPREMAGLEVENQPFTENSRLRFHYYEGTHGVQLKTCPFHSDKFVTVNDRVWKTASLKCPKGTEKVIFVCENTRTNQGACAIDEIRMVQPSGRIASVQPLC